MEFSVSRVIALSSLSAFGNQIASAAKEARFAPSQPQAGSGPSKPQPPSGANPLQMAPTLNTPRGALLDLTV